VPTAATRVLVADDEDDIRVRELIAGVTA